jgi:hypothetical protein
LSASQQIVDAQRVRQLLEFFRMAATQESIGPLFEIDAFSAQLMGQPVVLIEADPRGEGQVRADADEHAAPELIAEVKTVLDNPTPG